MSGEAFCLVNTEEARVRQLIARVANVPPDSFDLDDDLQTSLGLDSLSALRVAAGLEREFGITIPDERLQELKSVQDMLSHVRSQVRPAR